jgi:hypothetical protein
VRLLDHPGEARPLLDGELTVLSVTPVGDLRVVLMHLIGPHGPWDYAVATYNMDGTRGPGSMWQGPKIERANEVAEGYVAGWRTYLRRRSA